MDFYAYVKPQTGALLRYVPAGIRSVRWRYGLDGEKMYSVFSAMPGYGMLMANPMVKQVMDAFERRLRDFVLGDEQPTVKYPVASLLAQVKDPGRVADDRLQPRRHARPAGRRGRIHD